jgi:hypothetical protein
MITYLNLARQILSQSDKPLHYKDLTERAIKLGLKTDGATPWATMNAQLSMQIKKKGDESEFYRTEPGYFALRVVKSKSKPSRPHHHITTSLNTQQKGNIGEARVAELITLYGEEGLSCYRPLTDDEGIDIIVKKRGTSDVAFIQVKATFGDGDRGFVSTVDENSIINKRRMLMVFVYYDLIEGDLNEHVFCIPAPEFLKLTYNSKKTTTSRVFTVGLNKPDQSKYSAYLIEKRELANKILEILSET